MVYDSDVWPLHFELTHHQSAQSLTYGTIWGHSSKTIYALKVKAISESVEDSLPFKYSVGLYAGRRRPLVGVNPTAALIRIYWTAPLLPAVHELCSWLPERSAY